MRNRIFVDGDVILDVLMARNDYLESSVKIFEYAETGTAECFTSALISANIHYLISKDKNKHYADMALNKLVQLFEILSTDRQDLINSLNSKFNDFEDGVQYYTAIRNKIDIIITRNIRDYREADIKIFTPNEYIKINEE